MLEVVSFFAPDAGVGDQISKVRGMAQLERPVEHEAAVTRDDVLGGEAVVDQLAYKPSDGLQVEGVAADSLYLRT